MIWYSTVFDCRDAVAQAEFWAAALGWQVRRRDPDWATIGNPSGTPPFIGFGPVPEGKAVKNRLHLDLLPERGVAREQEQARLIELGATVIETIFEGDRSDGVVAHVVMADPEDNEFCLLEPHAAYFPT